MDITFIDFFSGIGGFHSGFERAGMRCVGWCEFDKYAQMPLFGVSDSLVKISVLQENRFGAELDVYENR